MISPPGLMDDVDAVQAQIARTMLESGDWVTARLNGVKYLEKAPLKYWAIAASYAVFGVHDWAARLPVALCAVLLCWVTARFAAWAFHDTRAGLWAGLGLATCVGLWLFTRVLIPDVMVTLTITLAIWGLLRALDRDEPHPRRWALAMWAAMGAGLLLKGLIAVVFPAGAAFFYLLFTGQILRLETWRRLHVVIGLLLMLAIAAPWHVLATLRNPPYFDFTLRSEHGQYRGFFWFYFINEHLLRFLNMRYPRDYNTVPRLWFWLFHLVWLFPWSACLPAVARLGFLGPDRGSRVRLMALCWAGVVLVFFTFSTTQEYYSMPAYPALALLLGCAIAGGGALVRWGTRAAAAVAGCAAVAVAAILWQVRDVPAPGDISAALRQNPELYTLSLGHAADLTLHSFAYLRLPLALAGAAFLIGAVGGWHWRGRRALASLAIMMALFFHAARLALVAFEPYLGSRPLAEALVEQPEGTLIADDQYYAFSSVFFYANRPALLLNGRVQNLIYGSYAPGAPEVFLDDAEFAQRWGSAERHYLVASAAELPRFEKLVGGDSLHTVAQSGGKVLISNGAQPPASPPAAQAAPEVRFLCFAPSPYTKRHDALRAGLGIYLSLERLVGEHQLPLSATFWDGIPALEDGGKARTLLKGARVLVVGSSTWAQGSSYYIRRYFELANNESLLGTSATAWATAGGSATGGELVVEDTLRTLMGMGAQTFSLGQKYMVFTTGERFSPREGDFTTLDLWYMDQFARFIALAALGGAGRAEAEALAAKFDLHHEYWRRFPKNEAAIAGRYRALRERLNAAADAGSAEFRELYKLVRTP
jgi:4-amino-4-deoxy-L-arabinose transferase-like glycosyltransferase